MSSNYFDLVTERASSHAYDPAFPFHEPLLSAESHGGLAVDDMFSYAKEHHREFYRRLDRLEPEQREMMIEYFVLRKTQSQIALLHGYNSQGCGVSEQLKSAVLLILGPNPGERVKKTRKNLRARGLRFRDRRILGEFTVNIRSSGARNLFSRRARQVSNAAAL